MTSSVFHPDPLRPADPLAFLRREESPVNVPNTTSVELDLQLPPMTRPQAKAPEAEPEPIDPKYLELLASLGFTEIPTASEIKAKLDERRDEVRTAVLAQSDKRSWCDDGTRQVCANLRLTRPGRREAFKVTATVTFELTTTIHAWDSERAIDALNGLISRSVTASQLSRIIGVEQVTDVQTHTTGIIDALGNPISIGGAA